jgi:hypothetical protein
MIQRYKNGKNFFETGELIYLVNTIFENVPSYQVLENRIEKNIYNINIEEYEFAAVDLSFSIGYKIWEDIKKNKNNIALLKIQNYSKAVLIDNSHLLYNRVLIDNNKYGFVLKEMCYTIDMFDFYANKSYKIVEKFFGFQQ